MPDPDYDLDTPPVPAGHVQRPRAPAPWLIAAGAMLAVGAAVWFFLAGRQTEPPAAEQPAPVAAAPPPAAPQSLCAMPGAKPLPSLDASDALVGKLVRELSSHPRVTAWLATDNLIRNFAVVVENIANGVSPSTHLGSLRPSGAFRVAERNGALFVDPRSYARYAPIAAAVGSVDAQAAAGLCAAVKPRLDDAYAELGREGSFDSALERAIVAMLRTPAPGGTVRLVPDGAVYAFDDEALERLTPAQKHLARMGPDNVRVIQDRLRQIALAIGIPSERLPQ